MEQFLHCVDNRACVRVAHSLIRTSAHDNLPFPRTQE
jgi:hypothetical protein